MKAAKIKLPFGLNENKILVHIADVESGKKCCCVCPSCQSLLIAAKGSMKQHHFKHAVINECEGGLESAIHLAAKKIIMEKKQITLSECISIASATDSRGLIHTEQETIVQDGMIILFNSVQEESALPEMKADLLAIAGNKPLIIEIYYRHKVDDQKVLKIKKANISAIEINLSDLLPENVKDWETFWSCINDPKRVQWLYNAKAQDRVNRKLVDQLAVKVQELEKKYKQEEIIKHRQQHKEKLQLMQALEELKILSSNKHVAQLNLDAETLSWKIHFKYLQMTLNRLPNYLNVKVPNGDWIFGCDRRIWQTAFFKYFIIRKNDKMGFSIKKVDDWLKDKAMCQVPLCAETVGIFGKRYPELIPPDILDNMPSSWETLRAYFNHLCELGMLEFSRNDSRHTGSCWFRIISVTPTTGQ